MLHDTIAAISTPEGVGALAVVRVSGDKAIEYTTALCSKDLAVAKTREALFLKIYSLDKAKLIDEAVVIVMKNPASFTGEDTVEIFCHGGRMVCKAILKELLKAGCRMALPGEFSKRAFLNGKIDMVKAESIGEVIHAKTEKALLAASGQLDGALSKEIEDCRHELILIAAHIAALLDYPEEGVPDISSLQAKEKTTRVIERLSHLENGAENGIIMSEGLNVVIAGKPNVGKSSLLNAILNKDRAIVTDIAGTTRDILCEQANIGGYLINLADTAGIRQTEDIIEAQGVERTIGGIKQAHLVVLVLDSSSPIDDEDKKIFDLTKDKNTLIVYNKCDISEKNNDGICISAKKGIGIDTLCSKIAEFASNYDIPEEETPITNMRQQELVIRSKSCLEGVDFEYLPIDIILCELENAISILGEITGENVSEDIIEAVFSNFCVGK
ncbi:MAG: tRNA uridine-5-carboxymethylaminomethyl(34) synthesis GTPase MnmE [Eubacteriales bacterium]|nr:tRNA uridine-5-carboxymethylaminomethyl(34) synthesis GTPase MnmE [Eubacteriales bacterium]